MQYVIVAIIIGAAAALVLVPLVRAPHGAGAGDLDEPAPRPPSQEDVVSRSEPEPPAGGVRPSGDVGPSEPETAGFPPERRAVPPPAEPRPAEPTVSSPAAPQPPGEAGAEELPQSAPPPARPAQPLGAPARRTAAVADAATEEEILRYREALRARTICGYCSTANPPGSKYCKECGEQLEMAEEDGE